MNLPKKLEKKIEKIERNIEKKHKQIEKLRLECKKHIIADYDYISQKKRIEEKINNMNFRIRALKGETAKKKRRKEERIRKKQEKRVREKSYFDWSKKQEKINNKGGEIKHARWR
jgi:hypothetical protein